MKNLAPEKVHWSKANSKSYCCYKRRDYSNLQFTKKLLYTLGFLGVFFVYQGTSQSTQTLSWTGQAIVNGNNNANINLGSFNFAPNSAITDISVSVTWEQHNAANGDCTNGFFGGFFDYPEIRMVLLNSIDNTVLIRQNTYAATVLSQGEITTTFEEGAASLTTSPTSGTFDPFGSFSSLIGGDPNAGDWILRVRDIGNGFITVPFFGNVPITDDELCVSSFSLTVTAVSTCEIVCPTNVPNLKVNTSCASPVWPDYRGLALIRGACDSVSSTVTQVPTPGDPLSAGNNQMVTITATSPSGSFSDDCTFSVNVINTNTGELNIVCPADQIESLDASCQSTLDDYTSLAMAVDECGNQIPVSNISQSPAPNTSFSGIGSTMVTLTVTDGPNTATCTFEVVRIDDTPPTLDACGADPAPITITANGVCEAFVNLNPPTIIENCSAEIYGVTSLGDTIRAGVSGAYSGTFEACGLTVVWYADDGSNPPVFLCSNTVEVIETTAPTASCEGGIILSLNADGVAVLDKYNYSSGSFDSCDDNLDIIVMSDPSYPTDDIGNIVFDCSALFAISTEDSLAGTVVKTIVTDCSENSEMCWNNVRVEDKVDPVITCPADLTINCTVSPDTSNTGVATATDNSDDCFPVRISFTDILNTQDTTSMDSCGFYSYIIERQWVAIDTSGNSDTCVQTIMVQDTTRPEWTATCTDFENGAAGTAPMISGYLYIGSFEGSFYYEANALSVWTDAHAAATAAGGHLAAIRSAEEEAYIFSNLPTSGRHWLGFTDDENFGGSESFGMPNPAVDGWVWTSGEPITYTNWFGGEPNNLIDEDYGEIGFFANDQWNDTNFGIMGRAILEIPAINCEFTVDCNDPNLQGILGYELAKAPTAEDDCKLDRIDLITNDTILGCPSFIIKEWLAYDACDNETADTFRQTITINDTIAPFITCPNGGNTINLQVMATCDTSITLEATATDCDAFAGNDNLDNSSWEYSVMALPSMVVIQSGSGSSFTTTDLDLGSYMVTFMVSDQCGNTASCQTSVIVEDGADPTLDCATFEAQFTDVDPGIPGTQITVGTDENADACGVGLTFTAPRPDDNCTSGFVAGFRIVDIVATGATEFNRGQIANAPIFLGLNNFSAFYNLGTTNLTFTYTDANGNVSNTCTLDITVVDDDAPVINNTTGGTLCQTFESSDIPVQLGPDVLASTSMNVVDAGTISSLEVSFEGTHSYVGDLTFCLIHPNGVDSVILVDRVGVPATTFGCSGNNFDLTFADGAVSTQADLEGSCNGSIPELDGTYQPQEALSAFVGLDAAGDWTLRVKDFENVDGGMLTAWSLDICTEAVSCNLDTVAFTNTNNPGDCNFEYNWKHPFVRENCDLTYTMTITDPNGNEVSSEIVSSGGSTTRLFGPGVSTVSYTAVDQSGNMDACSFEVTVIDNEAPQALCKDITVFLDENGTVTIDSNAVDNGSTDNCEIASFSTDKTTFVCDDDLGPNTVTLTVTDVSGNSFDCWATVTVVDNIIPTIECPADTTVFTSADGTGDCSYFIAGGIFDPVFNDNCPVDVFLDINDGNGFVLASTLDGFELTNADTTYTFTWKVVDASNNEASCTFTVTLEDDEQPSFNYCPADVVENTVGTDCNQEAKWHPPFITDLADNCGVLSISGPYSDDPSLVWDFSDSDTTRALFQVGDTEVWYVAEDINGNKDTCSFTVTIIDNVQPIINSCPTDISLVLNSDCNAPTMEIGDFRGSITFAENCTATVTQTPAPGAMWVDIIGNEPNEGDTVIVTLTVDDGSTTPVDCSFKIAFDDKDDPSIVCPADLTVYVDASCEYALEDFTSMATTDDNCGIVTVTQSPDPIATSSLYTSGDSFVVTLTADDGNGNTETCAFNVTVADSLPPKFVNCRDTALALSPGNCTVTFDGNSLTPDVTDNCPGAISVVGVRMDGGALNGTYNAGITMIEWTATDANGQTAVCMSTVDVSIIGLPNCKAGDITVSLNEFGKVEVCGSDLDEGSTSACGAAIVAVSIQRMGGSPVECDTFTCADVNMVNGVAQPTMVMLVIEDADGNMMFCMGSVTVKDLLPPVIVDCPDNQVLNTDTMVCTANVSIEPVEIKAGLINGASIPYTNADNCPVDTLYTITYSTESGWDPVSGSGDPSGDFPKGVSTIVWTIVDVGENTATCTTTITVNDNEAPIVTCPDASTVGGVAVMKGDTILIGTSYDDDYDCDAVVEGLAPTVWDNCNMGNACTPATLLFSEYAEGNSNNKCVEIFNGTGADVELSDYSIFRYSNGSSIGVEIALNAGTLPTGSVWVVCNSFIDTSIFSGADQLSGSLNFNGDDAVGLSVGGVTVDAIGQIGVDPGTQWSANGCSTLNAGLARNVFDNCSGSDGSAAFDPSVWASAGCLPVDDFSGFGVAPVPSSSSVDPCPITVTYVIEGATTASGSDDASGTNFLQGVSKLTYTAVDAYNNIGTCEIIIEITDDQAPMAMCVDTLDVFLDATGSVSILPADVDNGSTDNCMIDFMTLSDSTFTCDECPGKDVTLTVFDKEQGLSSTCVTYIRINDPIAPSITCVADQDRNTSDDETSADVDAGLTDCDYVATGGEFDPMWSDNCPDDVVISYSLDGGVTETVASTLDGFVFGNADTTYTVTWYARDKANTSSCTFTITIEDDEDPIPTCTAPVFANSSDDGKYDCGTYVSIAPTTATDNCGVLSINNVSPYADFPGADASGVYPVGTHTVMFFVTDVNNNVSTCSVQVTVTDDQKPTFDPCAADTTVTADAGVCTSNLTLTTSAFDNCIINQIDWTATLADGNVVTGSTNAVTNGFCTASPTFDFYTGVNTVEWVAIDVYGNTDTCTTTVTVTDDEAPVITCPMDVVQTTDPAACGADVPVLTATATDNCFVESITVTVTYPDSTTTVATSTGPVAGFGAIFPVGVTSIEYIAVDSSGNADTCITTVTITDDEDPMIVCPDDIVMDTDSAKCDAIVVIPVPVTSDNCEVDTFFHNSAFATAGGNDASGTYPQGTTVVEYVVIDIYGNSDTCSFSVTINDNEKPMITCSGGGTRTTSQDSLQFNLPSAAYDCGYTVGNANGTAGEFDPTAFSDNCCISSITHDFAGAPSPNTLDGAVLPVGTTTITWTIMDCNGNSEVCSDEIIVEDNETPVAKCKPDNCRFNLPTSGVFTLPQATIDQLFRPGNFDNCTSNADLDIQISKTSFDCSNIGENLITLTVTDEAGNSAFCTFIIEILENTPPDCFTQDITVYLDANGLASITTDMIDANSTDNCGIDTMFLDIYDFDCTNVGPNTVTLTVLDQNTFPQANMSTCTATVTVVDTIAPVCTTQDILVVLDSAGVATIDSNAIDDGSTDACGIASIEVDINTFGCADVGNPVTVTQTVTDVNGVVSTCTATVSVIDDIAPECLTMDIVVYLDENGDASIDSNGVDAGSNDVCGIDSIALDITDFTCADTGGPVMVTQTVTDNNGLTSTCTAMVTVLDTIAPTCETMDIVIYLDVDGEASIDSNEVNDGSTDNCEIASITLSQTDFTCTDVGTVTVTQTVTDNAPIANSSTCTAEITILDTIAPTMVCRDITIYLDADGNASTIVDSLDGGITDACGIASITASQLDFTCDEIGKQLVTVIATDVNGNLDSCIADVTVVDSIAPEAVCANIIVQLANGSATITAGMLDGGSTDNCTDNADLLISASQTFFTCADVGDVTVIVTVMDLSGNVDTCSAIVTIEDNEAPVAICQSATVAINGNGIGVLNPADLVGAGTSDICSGPSALTYSASRVQFDCTEVGDTIMVDLYVTDANGNSDTCSAEVYVVDNITPSITCKQTLDVVLSSDGSGSVTVNECVTTATDNCGNVNLKFQAGGGTIILDCSDVGSNLFVIVATDDSGNEATCQLSVNVIDNTAPTAICQDVTVALTGASVTVDPSQIDNGSFDECGCMDSTSMTLDQTVFTAVGTYPVVLTVFDCDGNAASCSANVVVTSSSLVEAELFMFLEGAYDFGTGEMTTMLNTQGHIPMAQPYNIPGYNYAGTETLSSIPADMTDWVLVRLYDGTATSVLLGEQAAVLLKDGSITDVNGGNLMFPAAGDYRVEVHHWTALAISSNGGLTDNLGVLQHDFRHNMSMALTNGTFTNAPMSDLFTGDYGMIAGNSLYIDANTDLNDIGWAFSEFGTFGRTSSDVNLDGAVDLIDIQIIFFNLFKFSHIP